jgi:hypothetical protein
MKKHLAIFSKAGIEQIISGQKSIETRFSKKRIAPFGLVSVGDLVYMKLTGGDIKGQFIVKKVIFLEGLERSDWEVIKKTYWDKISLGSEELDQQFLQAKSDAVFGTLIFVGEVEQFVTSPISFEKRDRRPWVVLLND